MSATRSRYLDALGIVQYRHGAGLVQSAPAAATRPSQQDADSVATASVATSPAVPSPEKSTATVAASPATSTVASPATAAGLATFTNLHELAREVSECRLCELCKSRTQTVFGIGNPSADCMLVGEAPGAEEDRQGQPFVGRAGQLLDAMLATIGLKRDEVYIANVLKCRPPRNRDPGGIEVQTCEPYLHRQIELVAPRLIVAMGRFAAQSLLCTTEAIGRLRGQQFAYRDTGIVLLVTYHPAYLLRNPADKRKAWDDLLLVQQALGAAGGASGDDRGGA